MKTIEFITDHIILDTFKKIIRDAGLIKHTMISRVQSHNTPKIRITTTCHEHELANVFLKFNTYIENSGGIWETYSIVRPSK
ncbi:MAG: hypothetical protein JWO58_2519 [Chitinophagaceae bacterium]|nr:hypothetical protein [Chitinophagaceae bacterium]